MVRTGTIFSKRGAMTETPAGTQDLCSLLFGDLNQARVYIVSSGYYIALVR